MLHQQTHALVVVAHVPTTERRCEKLQRLCCKYSHSFLGLQAVPL
jgi:hypothetical protein